MNAILEQHHNLDFFNKWLDKLTEIHQPDGMSTDDLKKYLDWKVEVNERPFDDKLSDGASELFSYRLVRDFFRELKPSFVSERTLKSMRIFRKYSLKSFR